MDLFRIGWVCDQLLNWMAAGKGVEDEPFLKSVGDVGIPEMPAWKHLVRSVPGH